jgi:hypothetical protein
VSKLTFRKTLFENIRAENSVDDVQWNPWTPLLTKFPMKNALFDFEEFCLTVADPDDMIQFTTGYDWPTDPDGKFIMPAQEDIQFVLDFFAEVTGDDDQFKYVLVLMAASLEGCNRFNEFVLMCGGGGNGKGLLMNLMAQVCGDLMQQLSPEFYQNTKGKDSSAPSPEVACLQYARIVNTSEPKKGVKFCWAKMKLLTGGESLKTRKLYGDSIAYMPQFLPFVQSNDDIELDEEGTDEASDRRITYLYLPFSFTTDLKKKQEMYPDRAHRFKQASAAIRKKCVDHEPTKIAVMVVMATVWKLEIKDLPDEQETSKTLSYYPPDLNRRRIAMLEKSDHVQVFIDKFYVKTSPAGYAFDEDLDGAIPAIYDGPWTDDTMLFDAIFEQYKETQKQGGDKGMKGDLRQKFIDCGYGIEYREKKIQDPKTQIVNIVQKTFIVGIKSRKEVKDEEEGKAALFDEKPVIKENLDTKFYPGPSKAEGSFYHQLLHHVMPDTKYVTARRDDVIDTADQKASASSAHGKAAAAAKVAVRSAVEEEGEYTGDVPTPAKSQKPADEVSCATAD